MPPGEYYLIDLTSELTFTRKCMAYFQKTKALHMSEFSLFVGVRILKLCMTRTMYIEPITKITTWLDQIWISCECLHVKMVELKINYILSIKLHSYSHL